MAKDKIQITEANTFEWLCSTGYLLPTNELELERFELLQPRGSLQVNENAIDPFAIINGTRRRQPLSFSIPAINSNSEITMFRMAARKHGELPDSLVEQLRKNQEKAYRDGDKPEQEK